MPNAVGWIQRQSYLKGVIAVDIFRTGKRLYRIVLIRLRHRANLIGDMRINQLQINPLP